MTLLAQITRLVLATDAHHAKRRYKAAQRDHRPSERLRKAWVLTNARVLAGEVDG